MSRADDQMVLFSIEILVQIQMVFFKGRSGICDVHLKYLPLLVKWQLPVPKAHNSMLSRVIPTMNHEGVLMYAYRSRMPIPSATNAAKLPLMLP